MLLAVLALTCVISLFHRKARSRTQALFFHPQLDVRLFLNDCRGFERCRNQVLTFPSRSNCSCFLFLALPFALLLCSTLYFTIRRHSPLPIFVTSFLAVDWERYSGRPVNRAATVKRTKNGKKPVSSPRVLEGAASNGGGTTTTTDSYGRPDSQAPVFAFHPGHGSEMSYGGASSIAAGGGDAANRSLDWDVRSSGFTDSFDRPGSVFTAGSGGGDGQGSGPARPEHSVFVLMEEEEKAMEAEAEAESAAAAAGAAKEETGAAGSAKEVGAAL